MYSSPKRVPRAVETLKNAAAAFGNFLFPPELRPQLAPIYPVRYARPLEIRVIEPDKPRALHFDTADLGSKKTPRGQVARWDNLDVLGPGDMPTGKGRYMLYTQAQAEVSAILAQSTSCHEYLTYEAATLLGTIPEVVKYTAHMMIGAGAEDYVFALGENFSNLCLGDPAVLKTKSPRIKEALETMLPRTTFLGTALHVISKIAYGLVKDPNANALDRPYFAHFYDPRLNDVENGLVMLGGELKFQSALTRIKMYWGIASDYYQKGDVQNAFVALGHMMHLVEDLHVPAHVHNDPHGPGNKDSFERWTTRADYPAIRRAPKEPNVRIWSSKTLSPPTVDSTWTSENIDQKLTEFVDAIVISTQRFRSVDAKGTDPGQQRTGKLSDAECFEQGETLIPLAIYDASRLVMNFLDYQRRTR